MRIGVLECGELLPHLAARHGVYRDMIEALLSPALPGATFVNVSVVNGVLPSTPQDCDAWVLSGSRHGVYDPLEWIERLKIFLRRCIADSTPIAGICFGHQILAEALGGQAGKAAGGWELGTRRYTLTQRPAWWPSETLEYDGQAVHQDQVTTIPPGATVLAQTEGCPIAAVAYGSVDRPDAISVQSHPEFTARFTRDLITARRGHTMPEDVSDAALSSLRIDVDNKVWATAIANYFKFGTPG